MKQLKFSKKLMNHKNFGITAIKQKDQWKIFRDIWYRINWNNRKLINLQKWTNANKNTLWSDPKIKKFVEQINNLYPSKKQNHRRATAAHRFVKKYIKYLGDLKTWSCREYFQTPLETWKIKTGDCEDGAILLNEILRMLKIPSYQRYIRISDVKGGRHAYLVYTSELDLMDYELDWCYWYDAAPIENRRTLQEKTKYYKTIFAFNENKSYKEIKNPNKLIGNK